MLDFLLLEASLVKIFGKKYVKDLPKTNIEIFFEVSFLIPLVILILGISIFSHQKVVIIIILLCLFIIIIEGIIYQYLGIKQIIISFSYNSVLQFFYWIAYALGIK